MTTRSYWSRIPLIAVLSFSSQIGTAGGTILAGLAIFGENIQGNPTPTPTPGEGVTPRAVPTSTNTPAGPPAVVPTLSFPMLALLSAALVGAALLLMRR